MKRKWEKMRDKQVRMLTIASSVLCLMAIVIFFVCSKGEFVNISVQASTTNTYVGADLYEQFETIADEKREELEEELKKYLRIELPENTKESDIDIEVSYIKQTMSIRIKNKDSSYMKTNPTVGSCNHIADLNYYRDKQEGCIDIQLDSVYEYESSIQENQLVIKFLNPRELYDHIIVVDAGHGGGHPGTNRNGILEKDLTLQMVTYAKELFDADENIRVYYTRLDDSNPSFDERVQMANKLKADYFLSVHINSNEESREPNGTEVLYYTEDNRSKEFAQICADEESKALNSRNRGITTGDTIYIIRNSKVPVALIEVGFISNNNEFGLLCSKSYQKKAAQGMYQAIISAYEKDGITWEK